jgi:hypothetical protein
VKSPAQGGNGGHRSLPVGRTDLERDLAGDLEADDGAEQRDTFDQGG